MRPGLDGIVNTRGQIKEVVNPHGIPDQSDMFRDWTHTIRQFQFLSSFPMTHPDDANLSQVLQLFIVPDPHNAAHKRIIPRIQLDTVKAVNSGVVEGKKSANLLMLFSSSDISLVLLSLDFICCNWRFFRTRAMNVFNGMEKI